MKKSIAVLFAVLFSSLAFASEALKPKVTLTEKELAVIEAEVKQMVEVTDATPKQEKQLYKLKKNRVLGEKSAKIEYGDTPKQLEKELKAIRIEYFTGLKDILTEEQHETLSAFWAKKNAKK